MLAARTRTSRCLAKGPALIYIGEETLQTPECELIVCDSCTES
jgi:hypothetical protein